MDREVEQSWNQEECVGGFCQKKLLVSLSGNETIPQLNRKAMDHGPHQPDRRTEWGSHLQDAMGFGKHASLSYEEVMMSPGVLQLGVEVCTMARTDGAHRQCHPEESHSSADPDHECLDGLEKGATPASQDFKHKKHP